MKAKIAAWLLERVNRRVNNSETLKYRIVLSDSRAYLSVINADDPETPYPVSESYYDNAALFYKGFVNEFGLNGESDEPPEHIEIPVDSEAVERVEHTSDIELTTTEAYKKHMTNHVFQQALTPVDPDTLGGLGLNKYYIWVALILLGIIAFGVAAGGLGGSGAAIVLPWVVGL